MNSFINIGLSFDSYKTLIISMRRAKNYYELLDITDSANYHDIVNLLRELEYKISLKVPVEDDIFDSAKNKEN